MNKQKMIDLLNKWGVKIPDNATEAQLAELVEAGKPTTTPENKKQEPTDPNEARIIALENQLKEQAKNLGESRRLHVTNEIDKVIAADALQANLKDEAIKDCIANPERLENFYKKLAPGRTAPGADPLEASNQASSLEVTGANIKDIAKGFEAHNAATKAWQRGENVSMETIRNQAIAKANFFQKFKNRFIEVMNTNTIATELKRQVILQDIIFDFERKVLSLDMFSTVYRNVALEGTDKVQVPFYDLDSSASTSFVSGTGYTTIGNTAVDNREVTIGEGATDGDRLFQALSFSSQEIARQPYLKIATLAKLKADKLASDIVTDVLSIITAANFAGVAHTGAAATFDSDDVANIKLACKLWPAEGRGLVLDSAYDANLLKDPAFKHALNAASDLAIKEGRLYPRVMGFDYTENPTIPANGENLTGFAFFKSAILCAFAPVPPVEEVRNAGTTYEMLVAPKSGVVLEYRTFGNNVTDAATHVIESSYGFAVGNATALKRVRSAA